MKIKMTMGFLLILGLVSCVDDFDGDGKPDLVTAENSAYEGDLFRAFLEVEIEMIDAEIQTLQEIIDMGQGTQADMDRVEELTQTRDGLKGNLADIPIVLIPGEVSLDLVMPPLPCPRPRSGDCNGLFDREFIVIPEGSINLEIVVLDANGGELGGTFGELQVVPNTEGTVAFKPFSVQNPVGEGTIKVLFEDGTGELREYSVAFSAQ